MQCLFQLTSGVMGGVRVPFLRPSQLKPSNHLIRDTKISFIFTLKSETPVRADTARMSSRLLTLQTCSLLLF